MIQISMRFNILRLEACGMLGKLTVFTVGDVVLDTRE